MKRKLLWGAGALAAASVATLPFLTPDKSPTATPAQQRSAQIPAARAAIATNASQVDFSKLAPPPPTATAPAVGTADAAWADKEAVLTKARELVNNPTTPPQELAAFFQAWGGVDGAAAMDFLIKHGGPSQTGLGVAVLRGWADHNPSEAQNFVENCPDTAEKTAFAGGVLTSVARRDARLGAAWVATLTELPGASALILQTFNEFGEKERHAAAQWLASLPNSANVGVAVAECFNLWAIHDPEAASIYVRDLGAEHPHRDHAAAGLARSVAAAEPEAAKVWAESIQNDALRDSVLAQIPVQSPQGDAAPGDL